MFESIKIKIASLGFRKIRQLILIIIPFAILGILILIGIYQFLPKLTCEDQIKNQNEEEVDCGGVCIPCIFKHIKDIEISLVKFDEVVPGIYDVIFTAKNPNPKLAAKEFFYDITLRDENKVIMTKKSGQSFLYAGETAHVVEAGLASKRKIGEAEISIDKKKVSWIMNEEERPFIFIGDKSSEIYVRDDGSKATRLRLKLINQTLKDFSNIEVGVAVFDSQKNLLAINKTLVDTLDTDGSVPLSFSWSRELLIDINNILVEPRINLLR